MCSPAIAFAGVGLALGVAQSYIQYQSQMDYANAQAQAQNDAIRQQQEYQNRLIQLENERYQAETNAVRARQLQEQQALARQGQQARKEVQALQATALVQSGEAGVTGLSVDALLADFTRQELNYQEAILRERQNKDAYYNEQLRQNRMQSAFTMAEMNRPITSQPIARPSAAGLAIGMLGQGVGAYRDYLNFGGGMRPERSTPRSVLAIPS
ncbi:MAG: hypothetical protein EB023_10930 [Flavobacteriia bacterium]|nr:hypothetical protein [Flavobacteriia bacterium]